MQLSNKQIINICDICFGEVPEGQITLCDVCPLWTEHEDECLVKGSNFMTWGALYLALQGYRDTLLDAIEDVKEIEDEETNQG